MEISEWLIRELDSNRRRITQEVWGSVPEQAQTTALENGNSIAWSTFHIARHAALALTVLRGPTTQDTKLLRSFPAAARTPDSGLHEAQRSWISGVEPAAVRAYADVVFASTREFLSTVTNQHLHEEIPVKDRLIEAEIGPDFGWLIDQWSSGGVEHLIRWPLLGHVTNHIGEMIATRNLLGYSPYR